MSRLRVSCAIIATTAAAVVLAGCGAPSPSAAPSSSPYSFSPPSDPVETPTAAISASESAAASTPSPTLTGMAGHGIVLIDCNAATAASLPLRLVDPDTGVVLASASDSVQGTTEAETTANLCKVSSSYTQQLLKSYDATFQNIIATENDADGSRDAGILNLASGSFSDVVAGLKQTGFGAAPIYTTPLGFDRAGNLHVEVDSPNGTASNTYYVWSNGSLSPDKSFGAEQAGNPGEIESPDGSRRASVSGVAPTLALSIPPSLTLRGGVFICPNGAAFVGSSRVICMGDTSLFFDLTKSTVSGTCPSNCSVQVPDAAQSPVLPKNSRTNSDFAPSPDGTRMAFLSNQGSGTSLYVTKTDGTSEPTMLMATGAHVLGWQ